VHWFQYFEERWFDCGINRAPNFRVDFDENEGFVNF